jgi:hypothetical protein
MCLVPKHFHHLIACCIKEQRAGFLFPTAACLQHKYGTHFEMLIPPHVWLLCADCSTMSAAVCSGPSWIVC